MINQSNGRNDKATQIQQLVDEYRKSSIAESRSDISELIVAHPELMPELQCELQKVRLFESAWKKAKNAPTEAEAGNLAIRCPHCRTSTLVSSDSALADITCGSCGGNFDLISDSSDDQAARARKRIGRFELVEYLGKGGFGYVWRARDTELDRMVAIKIPRRGMLTPEESEQLLREARVAAQLRHPNIVSVYEVGRDGDSLFIVSDLVQGSNLAEWITLQSLSFREVALLCATLAEALDHAHEAGVIHRDLKPQNVLIDDQGQPHLTDFGLARRVTGEVTMTLDGQVLGTPAYMSPEQARGEGHHVDRRTDIYSLGVILYELMTGERPFRGNVRIMMQAVVHEEPPPPRRLNNGIPRDLENIALKCLEKEVNCRYSSAREIAEDLNNYCLGKPVSARSISRFARGMRWCKRRPAVSSLAAAVSFLLLLLTVGGPLIAYRQAVLAEELRRSLYLSDLQSAADAFKVADLSRAVELLDRHRHSDLRTIEWNLLWQKCQSGTSTADLFDTLDASDPNARATRQLRYSAKGDLAAAHFDGSVTVWRDGQLLHRLSGHIGHFAQAVAFSEDGELVASSGDDKKLRIWRTDSGELAALVDLDRAAWSLAFSDQDTIIAPTTEAICRWNAETGEPLGPVSKLAFDLASTPSEHGDVRFALSADKTLLARSNYHGITIEDLSSGEACKPWKAYEGVAWCLSFSNDGNHLITGGDDEDPSVKVWDTATQTLLSTLRGHEKRVRAVRMSPTDSDLIASVGWDKKLKLWSLSRKKELATLVGHSAQLFAMDFSPDGRTLATAGLDGRTKLWDLQDVIKERLLWHEAPPTHVSFHPDGTLLSAGKDGVILCDSDSGDLKTMGFRVSTPPERNLVACTSDGRLYATLTDAWRVAVIDFVTQQVLLTLEPQHGSKLNCLAFSPSGSLLASGSWEGQITLWNARSGFTRLSSWEAHSQAAETVTEHNFWGQSEMVHDLVFLDEETLVSIGADRALRVWSLSVGNRKTLATERRSFVPGPSYPRRMVLSDDGRLLAVADEFGSLALYRTRPFERIAQWSSLSESGIRSLAFTPGCDTLVTGGWDGDLRFWDVQSQSLRMTLDTGTPVASIAAYQGRIAWVGDDRVVRLWRTD